MKRGIQKVSVLFAQKFSNRHSHMFDHLFEQGQFDQTHMPKLHHELNKLKNVEANNVPFDKVNQSINSYFCLFAQFFEQVKFFPYEFSRQFISLNC